MMGMIQNRSMNCRLLAEEFEVDRATVMRDLAFLRDRLGVDVVWDAESNSYVVLDGGDFLPCMELGETDKFLLGFFAQVMAGLGETELGRAMQDSYRRLYSIFTGKALKADWGIPVSVDSKTVANLASQLRVFHLAQRALRSGGVLAVRPSGANGGEAVRVRPKSLSFVDGKWMLEGVEAEGGFPVRLDFSGMAHVDLAKSNRDFVKPSQAGAHPGFSGKGNYSCDGMDPDWHPPELKAA